MMMLARMTMTPLAGDVLRTSASSTAPWNNYEPV
jgi:hypothetical protein